MKNLKFQSVFDIIGPVMIGPSSNHTVGAIRVGKVVNSIFGETPDSITFHLYNSFTKTYRGHGTDKALVAGILGIDTDSPDTKNSLEIAHRKGIRIYWDILKDSNAPHPNAVKITVEKGDKSMSITGVSIGRGNVEVTELNGFSVPLKMNTPTLIIVHQDIPGMTTKVTDILSEYHISIAQMNVTRERTGERAITIIEVDSRDCHRTVEQIQQIPHLHDVNLFD